VDDSRQTTAINELHRVVVNSVIAAYPKDGHDVRVVELRGGLSLDLEPLTLLGIDRGSEWQNLERNLPAE
jgi:hypothetical protein